MKKIFLSLAITMFCYFSYAQTFTPTYSISGSGSANSLIGGYTFAYATSGSPWNGAFMSFGGFGNNYDCQISTDYGPNGGNHLSFRTRNGDAGTWNSWNEIWNSSNLNNSTTNFSAQNIYTSGNVGIGTTSPSQPLSIPIVSNAQGISLGTYSSLSAGQFAFVGITGVDGTFNGGNLSSSDNGSTGMAIVHTSGGYGNSAELAFITHNNGVDSRERLRIDRSGNVGIGTTTPDAKLAVKGTIHTQEVKVDMTGWSDYVFDKTYSLPTLSSVKIYIDQNHHLPEVPSEAEIIKNGVNLGEMVKLQTKKIEELTLYLIEQNKRLEKLEAQLKEKDKQ